MNVELLPIESIRERDIDLLLLEEFACNDKFCAWFANESGLPPFIEKIGIWRSINDFGLGETDLLLTYVSQSGKIMLLIENKLDASFQESQFSRYEKRAVEYVKSRQCDLAFVVLIAPEFYCENQNEFENFISYEQISKRFEELGDTRSLFKRDLLKIGSEKLRRGYQPVNSVIVQRFWHDYYKYKEQNYPTLYMKKPGIVPQDSDWPMLYDEQLKNITFYHKLAQGNVDATFKGFDQSMRSILQEILLPDSIIVNHAKSFSVRIFSGKVDRTKEFNSQIENIDKGLKNLVRLRDWLIKETL